MFDTKVKVSMQNTQTIEVTPMILAEAFFQMDDFEQREFFEALAEVWGDRDFDNQMYYVGMSGDLSDDAREIMRIIGKHAGG